MLSTRGSEQLNDRAKTLRNRARLSRMEISFSGIANFIAISSRTCLALQALSILEIGSGTSPLKRFHLERSDQ